MPLEEYRKKRDFASTPEPKGEARGKRGRGRGPTFVIHKHAARQLHYDLRLEVGGVLASWAVPKGPSLDPADKHLAVHVEDHPLEYGGFEGVIPKGEYGAGTVMIWDRGTFTPVGDAAAGIAKGHLKFELAGGKLKGAWALVRMKPRPGEARENWLLIKERDDAVREDGYDVLSALPDSEASGRTMDAIAAAGATYEGPRAGDVAGPDRAAGGAAEAPAGRKAAATVARRPARTGRPRSAKAPMPADAPFQLATLVREAPEGPGWLHEVKYDGYRLRIIVEGGSARALTRTGQDWTDRFRGIAAAARELPVADALLDGEAVVFDAEGRSDFGMLQRALSAAEHERIVFAAFDLLYLDGYDLRSEPLRRRKELLRSLLDGRTEPVLRYVEDWEGHGPDFHASACGHLLEGSVSKRADRPWEPGRTRDWQKAKCLARQEFVVVGFTDPAGSRRGFGALLLAVREGSAGLRYAGRVGTGFDEAALADLRRRLDRMVVAKAAVDGVPRAGGVHWVRPELVAEVAFREWTSDGLVRQAAFKGLREDKDPSSVVRERPSDPPARAARARRSDPPSAKQPELTVSGVTITNPGKVLDPAGISKRDLALYYEKVAPSMLPHLAGRLLTVVRCPFGEGAEAAGGCFYQKHPEARGWPKALLAVTVRDKEGPAIYFHADDAEGLISLAQMGCLEIHTWGSLASDPERPDRIILDLDPGEGLSFADVAEAARTVRDAVGALGLAAFAKTTGGHGMHVVIPVEPEHDFGVVRAFAHRLCERVAQADPERFTDKMAKRLRPNRVFIDYLRNAHGATAVCAFSTRARPGAPVSVPVAWDELARLDPAALDTRSVPRRLAALKRDPWEGYEASRARLSRDVLAAVDTA